MKRIAVLTSGGDAPGMNAAIRAVVRTGIDKKWQIFGVRRGYAGLIDDNFIPLGARDVSGILQKGGTMLGSARCPEVETDPETVATELRAAYERGKTNALVVVAEGAKYNAEAMAHYFAKNRMRLGFDLRVTTLGHVQRGGVPGAFDRLLAARLGAAAVDQLAKGGHGVLVGLLKGEIATTPLTKVVANKKPLDLQRLELAKVLAK